MRYTTKVILSSQATLGNFGRVWASDVMQLFEQIFRVNFTEKVYQLSYKNIVL